MNVYAWEDLRVGLTHSFRREITSEMLDLFLRISGDESPLHLDADFAAKRGYRDRVVYGMLTASLYSTLAGVHLPGRNCLLHGIDVAFMAPVFVGDILTVSGEITHLTEAYRQAQISATISKDQGGKVSKAKIRVGLLEDKHA